MTDIYVNEETMQRLFDDGQVTNPVFETEGYCIVNLHGLTVMCHKEVPKRKKKDWKPKMFADQRYPFFKIGYTSISSWKVTKDE